MLDGCLSLQVPTSEAAVSADTHAFARLPPGGLRKNRNLRGLVVFVGKRPRPLVGRAPSPGGPGPKPPGDLAHRPLGPGSRHSHWWGSRLRSSISDAGPAGPKPLGPGQQAPEPCIPVKNSKNAPVLIGS